MSRERDRRRAYMAILVEERGGQCENCGYSGNYAALCFHHPKPETKAFEVSGGNWSLERRRIEAKKCKLWCHNCHMEHHNPDLARVDL